MQSRQYHRSYSPQEDERNVNGHRCQPYTKKARNGNTRYVRCKIEDPTGLVECLMWPDEFVKFKDDFIEDRILFAEATVEQSREEPQL